MRELVRLALATACLLGVGPAAVAEEPGPTGGCEYDHRVFPESTEHCRAGTRVRCIDGAWADVGLCEDAAEAPPISGGADVEEDR